MSDIGDYTTTEQVRSSLGLTDNEVTDTMLESLDMEVYLYTNMYTWLPDHPARWATSQKPSPTPSEEQVGRLIEMFAQWYCASLLADMWLAFPQRLSDGKTDIRRFDSIDLEELSRKTRKLAASFKSQLLDEIGQKIAALGLAGSAPPSYDAVTNTTS